MDTVAVTETAGQMWTIVVVGIGTVFLCLFALVVMVSIFKAIFVREPKATTKATPPAAPVQAQAAPTVARGIDGAIVAAIVAAVSAASGVPAASLRIASIERSGFNTPAWGHIDRA